MLPDKGIKVILTSDDEAVFGGLLKRKHFIPVSLGGISNT